MTNKITTVVEFVTDKAQTSVQRFRTSVADADGMVNKFKAGAASAFSSVVANAGAMAVGAGAAIATFALKSVNAFTDVAKAAIDGSAATGIAVEDFSRWIAVADDMEVSAEQLTMGLGRIGKTLDSGKWEKYGVATRDASGQARNANDILLDTFDMLGRISNETERARVGNELFGRGYANIAPLIGKTRQEYERYLGAVEDGQVVTAEEAASAERTRLAIDRLQDSVREISLVLGESLAPVVADIADGLSDASDAAVKLKSGLEKIPGMPKGVQLWWEFFSPKAMLFDNMVRVGNKAADLGKSLFGIGGGGEEAARGTALFDAAIAEIVPVITDVIDAEKEHTEAVDEARDAIKRRGEGVEVDIVLAEKQADAQREAAEATDRMRRAARLNAAAIRDQTEATLGSLDSLFDYEQSVAAAWQANDNLRQVLEETPDDLWAVRDAQIAGAEAALDQAEAFAAQEGATAGSVLQAQLMKLELEALQQKFPGLSDAIQGYIDKLNEIPAMKTTQLVVTSTGAVTTKQTVNQFGRLVAGAEGAIVNRPTLALIGEAGPEAVVPLSQSPGNSPLPVNGAGGGARNVSVQIDGRTLFRIMWDETERQTRNGWRPGPGVRRVMAS